MPAERSQRIERLYHEAREHNPSERAVFLDEACAGDENLRREVESLLAEDSGVRSFLEKPALSLVQKVFEEDGSHPLVGRRLGAYSVLSFLARGGMGEVYRARDMKLKREVAIKILPEEFSRDRARAARFQREAEVLASLNHPNIAAIYDLEEAEGARFLVLEFVEGETLAERIARGPIPIERALKIAVDISEALEAAHEKGITHRDLKPANIKVDPDGKVKVLDFGLAKFVADELSSADSPLQLTTVEAVKPVILGTAAYMSPEQAQGQHVDRRTDIVAFGCVLYEMLAGQPAFQGKDTIEILGRVVAAEPDWSRLPAQTPWLIQRLLRRMLRKDARQRLGDIRDARIEIDETLAGSSAAHEPGIAPHPKSHSWPAWTIALALASALAVVSVLYFNRGAPVSPTEIRLEVNTPPTEDPTSFAISPDGRRLVFLASAEGKSQLWVRPLDSVAAQALAGTEGARYPFWSTDSASVGFFADGKLKRIDLAGGTPKVLANASVGWGGTWNRDGTILFGVASGPLVKVSASGDQPAAVTKFETGQTHHEFPQFLPDGRHFIYLVRTGSGGGIYAGSLDGGASRLLTNSDTAAVVSPSGFLFFERQRTLFAQTFDFKRQELTGNPFPVTEQAAFDLGGGPLDFPRPRVLWRTGRVRLPLLAN